MVDDIAERYEAGQPGARRHHLGGEVREAQPDAREAGIAHEVLNAKQHTREAEIVAQAGRLQGGHGRHQHGRSRRRHPPRRQPRDPRPRDLRAKDVDLESDEGRAELLAPRGSTRRVQGRGRQGPRAGRPLRARHRAPRVAPHRQPAPWPVRPAGRPRREPLLPVARGRPHAPVRHRRHQLGDGQGLPDDVPLEAKMVTKAIERAQTTVEQKNGEIRKNVLKYDEVMNAQRKVIYALRDQILDEADLRDEDPRGAPARGGRGARRHLLRGRLPRGVGPRRPPRRRPHLLALADATSSSRRSGAPTTSTSCSSTTPSPTTRSARASSARRHAPGRAPGDAQDHRHEVARAPLRDGLPPGGHQPAGHGPEGPAHRVAARGLRDVRHDDEGHRPGPREVRDARQVTCRQPPAPARSGSRAARQTARRAATEPPCRTCSTRRPTTRPGGGMAPRPAGRGGGGPAAAPQAWPTSRPR